MTENERPASPQPGTRSAARDGRAGTPTAMDAPLSRRQNAEGMRP